MAISGNYVLRETYTNLTRNITLTLATILTVTVSLAILGNTIILQRGAGNMTKEWDGGIQFMVYVDANATPAQVAQIRQDLDENPLVKRAVYVNRDQTYADFKKLFADRPAMLKSVEKNQLPTRFKVEPTDKSPETVDDLVRLYRNKPHVYDVRAALDVIKQMKNITGLLNKGFWVTSGALIVASVLLILNTIRTAMYARRREIEVMKLVGATNWFIRIPFMIEGLIQGLIGGVLASAAVIGVRNILEDVLARTDQIALVQNFTVGDGDVVLACVLVVAMAVLLSVISAALATRRFLDV